jgi:hypothetical protein
MSSSNVAQTFGGKIAETIQIAQKRGADVRRRRDQNKK